MTPDLNQLRRDLGLQAPSQGSQRSADESAPEQVSSGTALNDVGVWLLTILGIAIGIWLLADPICMLAAFLWQMICAVASIIFNMVLVIIAIMILFSILGSMFK